MSNGDAASQSFFMESGQRLPLLIEKPVTADILDAMKVHCIRLAEHEGSKAC